MRCDQRLLETGSVTNNLYFLQIQILNPLKNNLLLKLYTYVSNAAIVGSIFKWVLQNTSHMLSSYLFSWCLCHWISLLLVPLKFGELPEVAESHIRGVGWLLNHRNATICEKTPEISEMCMQMHCCDAQPTHEIPFSFASSDKQQVLVASEPQHNNVDSQSDLQRCTDSEQSCPWQKKCPFCLLTVTQQSPIVTDLGLDFFKPHIPFTFMT